LQDRYFVNSIAFIAVASFIGGRLLLLKHPKACPIQKTAELQLPPTIKNRATCKKIALFWLFLLPVQPTAHEAHIMPLP